MKIKNIIEEAFVGFLCWTGMLSPYMLWIVKVSFDQYIAWLGMQALIVPILAPIVFRITKFFVYTRMKK